MRTSESTATLAKKLVGAQADMKNAQLDGTNPHFGSKYATLAAIREATVPALHAHGIAMVQGTHVTDDGHLLAFTRLSYEDEWYESTYPVLIEKPQQMGSAITYAKRYMLAAMCGIVAEEDDDGHAAQQGVTATMRDFNVDNKLGFGKHANMTWRELARDMPGYIGWVIENTDRLTAEQASELGALVDSFSEERVGVQGPSNNMRSRMQDDADTRSDHDLDLSGPVTAEQKDQIHELYLALATVMTDAQKKRCKEALEGTEEVAAKTIEWMTDKLNSLAAAGA